VDWYLDACSLLNLVASGKLPEVVEGLGLSVWVVPKVYPEEAGFLYALNENERGEPEPLDLTSLFATGIIRVAPELSEQELESFVAYAALIDDGEAMTIAAAVHRGGGVVTDELRAWRVLSEYSPDTPRATTVSLVKQWASASGASRDVLVNMFECVRIRARYVPSPRQPDFTWFLELMQDE
jgi:hypothetical protein